MILSYRMNLFYLLTLDVYSYYKKGNNNVAITERCWKKKINYWIDPSATWERIRAGAERTTDSKIQVRCTSFMSNYWMLSLKDWSLFWTPRSLTKTWRQIKVCQGVQTALFNTSKALPQSLQVCNTGTQLSSRWN